MTKLFIKSKPNPIYDDICEKYKNGFTAKEAADSVGVSDTVIYRELKRRGIKTRKYIPKNISLKERFYLYIFYETNSGCWLWDGCYDKDGYGKLCGERSHRISWKIHRGDIPKTMLVCHHCDTPTCVNPEHLYLGTNKKNMEDKMARGRHVVIKGSLNKVAILNEEKALAIYNDCRKIPLIASEYGVSIGAIYNIKYGRNWAHVTGGKCLLTRGAK